MRLDPRPSPRHPHMHAFSRLTASPIVLLAGFVAAALAASCGTSPTQPDPTAIRITAVTPSSGSTFGGAAVTITGTGFGSGATVVFGGVPASDVSVAGATTLTATSPPHSAGAVDVVVGVGARRASSAGAFRYETPMLAPNAPPVVLSLSAQGPRPGQPAGMGDLGEMLTVTATVTNVETPPAALIYEWSSPMGTFVGAGATVSWRAPAALPATPVDTMLTVTVVERYMEPDAQGLPVAREHRVTRATSVRVHDSAAEIGAMAERFLTLFSMSSVPTSEVLSDFSPTCGGRAAEADDVNFNRCAFTITAWTIGQAGPTAFHFGGRCTLIAKAQPRADACTLVPARWVSTVRPGAMICPSIGTRILVPGTVTTAEGLDQVTAVYENGRWRLCDSTFDGVETSPVRFKR
jgi:IPT/TIG domain